jgi:hypothetical protein
VDRPFPLDQRPLSRLSLFRLAADDHLGLLLTHHIICDARAQEVLARDLAACYLACAAGAEPVLPPLPVQWADFAAWHRRRLAGPRGAEELAYWSRRMSGAVPALLPADVEPPPHQGPRDAQRGDMLITAVPPDLFAAVSKLTRTYRTTFYTVGLVAFAVLLARRSGQRDIGVNAPISYRDRVELHDLVADFSNDVIVRTDLSGAPTFDDLLHNARSALSEDFARYDLPPHLLTPYLSDPELIRRMQHVQFTAEREVELPEQTGPLRIEPVIPPRQYVLRPLSVRFRHDDDHAILIARYRTNRFTRQRAAELVAEYLGLLGEMAADPRRRALPG